MICLPQAWFAVYSFGTMCLGAGFISFALVILFAFSFAKSAKMGDESFHRKE